MAGTAIIRQVDHVYIQSDAPEALFSFLSDVLQLPVAWPFAPYGTFASGGVSVGNANIEAIRFGPEPTAPALEPRAHLMGIAFEPEPIDVALAELDRRGVPHTDPAAQEQDGEVLWNNVILTDLLQPPATPSHGLTPHVFLCAYQFDVAVRRARLQRELEAGDGGPLGILSLAEISIGVTDYEQALTRWRRALDPAEEVAQGAWSPGSGPAVRLVPDREDRIQSLTFEVRSMSRARDFLAHRDVPDEATDGQLRINPAAIQGLTLYLRERL